VRAESDSQSYLLFIGSMASRMAWYVIPALPKITTVLSALFILSNKPFLIWLLTTPPHLKYAATLPCNLSLMACFADSNVSQGSVATQARHSGIFNMRLTTNLPKNLPVKKNRQSIKI